MKRLVLACLFCSVVNSADLVSAVHQVESSGRIGKILGDSGRALGPLQIHYANWKDATDFDKSIKGKYSDCEDLNYSKKIFKAYLAKYASGKTLEQKARIWNGGPQGHLSKSTLNYWLKIKKYL
jgi:hypothetical protein